MRASQTIFVLALVAIQSVRSIDARACSGLKQRLEGFQVAAHRGGGGFPDENTTRRFEAARLQGADIVETDLRISKDGVVFLFHDRTLGQETSCHGEFKDATADEIGRCHLEGTSQGPDTFEEALQWSAGRVVIDAELRTPDVIEPAIDLVQKYDAHEWVYFQAGNGFEYYDKVRARDARIALLLAPKGEGAQALLESLLQRDDACLLVIQLRPENLNSDNLERIRKAGKFVSMNAWWVGSERPYIDIWPLRRKAACEYVYARGATIAVTKVPEDCAKQRATFPSGSVGATSDPIRSPRANDVRE